MIILLNGTPRSGKTSIAREIQRTFASLWVNLGVDSLMATTPERYWPGVGLRPGGERPDLEPVVLQLYRGLFASVAAHAEQGINIVVDVGLHSDYRTPLDPFAEAMQLLGAHPKLIVGVRCPTDVVMQRRAETGMVASREMVERWEHALHDGRRYDLEVDTSILSPSEVAEVIRGHLGLMFHLSTMPL